MRQTEFQRHLSVWGKLWGIDDLPSRVSIEFSTRMRSSLGRCKPSTGNIRIHSALSKPVYSSTLITVLCHEAAHVAAYLKHGNSIKPHGPEWKSLAHKAGISTRASLSFDISKEELGITKRNKYIYKHQCTICQGGFTALRTDRRWRCKHCSELGIDASFNVIRKLYSQ